MSSFRKTLDEFRVELQVQAEQASVPRLQKLLDREHPKSHHALRWAAAAVLLVTLGSIPLYREAQKRERQEQERADAQLLKQINASLSRSVPRAFGALATGGQE